MPDRKSLPAEKAKRIAERYIPTTGELLDRCYRDIAAKARRGRMKCKLFLPKPAASKAKIEALKENLSNDGYDVKPVAHPPKDKWGLIVSWS